MKSLYCLICKKRRIAGHDITGRVYCASCLWYRSPNKKAAGGVNRKGGAPPYGEQKKDTK